MKTHRILLVISVLLVWFRSAALGDKFIREGICFFSPDGRYSVHLDEMDISHFVIKNTATGEVDRSIVMPTALLYLHWGANSKSFVTVEHISKGSYGRVVYLADGKWRDLKVEPAFGGKMNAKVIQLQLQADIVHYRFAVTKLASDWTTPLEYSFCDLDISLTTGDVSNVKWTPTSEAALAATLWPHKSVYLPPMQASASATCVDN